MSEAELATILRIAAAILAVALTIAGAVLAIYLRRVYHSIDLLFAKHDRHENAIAKIKLAMVAVDPSRTAMFEAFLKDDA